MKKPFLIPQSSVKANVKKILIIFFSWKVLTLFLAFFAPFILTLNPLFTTLNAKELNDITINFGAGFPYLIRIWANFDGLHYLQIARSGYFSTEYPFFPLYPILTGILSKTSLNFIPYIISGQIVSNLSFLLGLIFSAKLIFLDKKNNLFPLIIFIIILFPTSFFYGAIYNDSLFFFLATAAIYYARKKSWFVCCIFGLFATITRLNGLALFFLLFFEFINANKQGWELNKMVWKIKKSLSIKVIKESKIYSIMLIPFAFFSYLLYVWFKTGEWDRIFTSMRVWHQSKITFPGQVVYRYIKIFIYDSPSNLNYWIAVGELFFVFLYIFLLIYSYKKIRFSYWIFFAVSILIPSLTGTFQGMPRYGLHLYPFFLSLAIFLKEHKMFKIFYFILSALMLFLFLVLFTRGYFVA